MQTVCLDNEDVRLDLDTHELVDAILRNTDSSSMEIELASRIVALLELVTQLQEERDGVEIALCE